MIFCCSVRGITKYKEGLFVDDVRTIYVSKSIIFRHAAKLSSADTAKSVGLLHNSLVATTDLRKIC